MFDGIIPAIITPTLNDRVDFNVLEQYITWLSQYDISAIFALGTTGEGPLVDFSEWESAVGVITDAADGQVPVVVQCGGISLTDTNKRISTAMKRAADAVAVMSPYFYKYDDEAVYRYYRNILRAWESTPFFLYNIPKYTGNTIDPSVYQRLATEFDNLKGIKDSAGNLNSLQGFISAQQNLDTNSQSRLSLFSGSDSLLQATYESGANGIVSGIAGAFPEIVSEAWADLARKNLTGAHQVKSIRDIFHRWSTIACVRSVLKHRGIEVGKPFQPMLALAPDEELELLRSLDILGIQLESASQ